MRRKSKSKPRYYSLSRKDPHAETKKKHGESVTHCENSEVQITVFSKRNMLQEWKLVQRFTFCLSSTKCK